MSESNPSSEPFEGTIAMTIPPDARLVRPVRLAVGGLAALAGFDVESIDDLRIAVNELTATLIERGDGSELSLQIAVIAPNRIRVEASTAAGADPVDDGRFTLSDQILSVVADDHGFERRNGHAWGWIVRDAPIWADDGHARGPELGSDDAGGATAERP